MLNVLAGPRPRPVGRVLVTIIAMVAALATSVTVASDARADASSSFVAMTNSARAASGLPPLSIAADLSAAARQHSGQMAASGVLAHTANLPQAICCWSALGENVGEGASASSIQAAFMGSPEHRANILSASYTQIGVGVVVDAKGTMWVTEIFRRPSGAAAPAYPAPAQQSAPRVTRSYAAPAPAPVHAAAPTQNLAAAQAGGRASRDLTSGRAPLDAARRYAAELARSGALQGGDPVSRVLNFVAAAVNLPQ